MKNSGVWFLINRLKGVFWFRYEQYHVLGGGDEEDRKANYTDMVNPKMLKKFWPTWETCPLNDLIVSVPWDHTLNRWVLTILINTQIIAYWNGCIFQVNKYYDLATSFYEYGWGESFHFAHRWFLSSHFSTSLFEVLQ